MKKTIIALLALAGMAVAGDVNTDNIKLTLKDVTFTKSDGTNTTTLTSGNAAMTWDGTTAYTFWYMEFTLPTVTRTGNYIATITTGNSTTPSNGLSVSVTGTSLTLGSGHENVIENTKTLSFSTTNVLTFAFYDGVAYLGNKSTGKYIFVTPSSTTTTTMTSGTSRAWANNVTVNNVTAGSTQIGATKIASLDGLVIPEGQKLDMATLMTTGVAKTMPVPEPTTATLSLLALAGLAARRRRK